MNKDILTGRQYTGKTYAVELLNVFQHRVANLELQNMDPDSSEYESSNSSPKLLTNNRHMRHIFANLTCFDRPKSNNRWITYANLGDKRPGCAWCRYLLYQKQLTSKTDVPYAVSRNQHFCSHCDVSLCTRAHFDAFHACPLVPQNQIVNRGHYQMTVLCLIRIRMCILVYFLNR